MKKDLVKFGRILKEARLSSSTPKQGDIASKLNCSPARLSQYEQGTISNPSSELFRKFAAVYEISYEGLIAAFVQEKYGVGLGSEELAKLTAHISERSARNVLERLS
jgi:transcriptional regulator with XRE-family HTH domain